jgi:hypothetical protein
MMQKGAVSLSPRSVAIVHSPEASSKVAERTLVLRRMSRRRARRSATKFRYARISGCVA